VKRILVLFVALGLMAAACTSDGVATDAGSADTDSESLSSEAVDESNDVADDDAAMEADESDGAEGSSDGGDEAGGGATAGDVLDAAELDDLLAATSEQTSGRFEATMELTGGPTSEMGTVNIQFSGAFDEATASSEISMDMSGLMGAALEADPAAADDPDAAAAMAMMAPFFEEPMQVRTIGDRSWVKWGLLAMFGVGDKWLETDADGSGNLTQDFGVDTATPADALSGLADSGHTVEFVGQEELRGMTADRYRSEIDVASMTAEQRAAFGDDLPENGSYTLDLWVADEFLQRFQIEMTDLEQTAENDIASVTMIYDLFDHGAAVDITPPPAAEVVTEAELGFDLGDVSGMGG